MAAQFAWTQETPELDYATTESSGEHVEDFQRTPTPEAQVSVNGEDLSTNQMLMKW
ncbi:hypothetical protein CERZMDRAFT_89523 [Cercospora zeae-maydis SCOH1-5]|uniref:Uncharacterized protein n=1 Tax=Cercospora zeae-maydis SCOH1-5 TaxID=717836 RepID=A0A6A6FW25_9PEZI|nr:hypothetical protein CERZMDRAFT_89523 [Cercospora zeae-maydis SCOH1-5]